MEEKSYREAREEKELSQIEAARIFEVSNAFLSAVERGEKAAPSSLLDKMAQLYGVPRSALVPSVPEAERTFIGWLRQQVQRWDSRFLWPTLRTHTRLVTDLYVEVTFKRGRTEFSQEEVLKAVLTREGKRNKPVLLAGSVGSGKSFFLRWLTLKSDEVCACLQLPKQVVPLLLSLGEYRPNQNDSLPQSLAKYYTDHGYEGSQLRLRAFFAQCLKEGRALVMCDGLDEIHNAYQRGLILEKLQRDFATEMREAGNRLMISGREEAFPPGTLESDDFRVLHTTLWRSSQMYKGCQRWYADVRQASDQEVLQAVDSLWMSLTTNDELFRLAQRPLLFHLLTQIGTPDPRSFRELAALCGTCCKVLETTWGFARRTFQTWPSDVVALPTQASFRALELPEWFNWRDFLVELVEGFLTESPPRYQRVFSSDELKTGWQRYLESADIRPRTLEFKQLDKVLQSLLEDHTRVGPLVSELRDNADTETLPTHQPVKYRFLDELFENYYYALALLNQPQEARKAFVLNRKRHERWGEVIALAIQHLGSSGAIQRAEGEDLLRTLIASDDSLRLEHAGRVGFGVFIAMRSLSSHFYSRDWVAKDVIRPFLEFYIKSQYERDVSIAFKIFGEYSTSRIITNALEDLDKQYPDKLDMQWRLLAAKAKTGRDLRALVHQIDTDMSSYIHDIENSQYRTAIRRYCFAFKQIGRLLASMNEGGEEPEATSQSKEVVKALMTVIVEEPLERLRVEAKGERTYPFHDWHVLGVIIQSQHYLDYKEDLKNTVNKTCEVIATHFEYLFENSNYRYKLPLIQALKAITYHSDELECSIRDKLADKLEKYKAEITDIHERPEIKTILVQLDRDQLRGYKWKNLRRRLQEDEQLRRTCLDEIYGCCDMHQLLTRVRELADAPNPEVLRLATATCCLETFHDQITDHNLRNTIVKSLLVLLDREEGESKGGPTAQEREEDRIFTKPFSDYCFPLYDHLHNCIEELARGLPLIVEKGGNVRKVKTGVRAGVFTSNHVGALFTSVGNEADIIGPS